MRTFIIVLPVGGVVVAAPPEPASRSATRAKQLMVALKDQQLEAIAAPHPDEPDRFVAACSSQRALLVVSARYASPEVLQARLSCKQYRDVYIDLSASPVPDSSIFFQDMNADGLCSSREANSSLPLPMNGLAVCLNLC